MDEQEKTAKELLSEFVKTTRPVWKYEMGSTTGYHCLHCRIVFEFLSEFADPDRHDIGCLWARAKRWLGQPEG